MQIPERVRREATFWLRPGFVLRVVRRFKAVEGFDRAMALSSSAFTALIPLTILAGVILPWTGSDRTADRLIKRFELTGGGAEAVRDAFSPPDGVETSLGVLGVFFVLVAALSFSRALQRLIERSWELEILNLRNTRKAIVWLIAVMGYGTVSGFVASIDPDAALLGVALRAVLMFPVSVAFWVWTGWQLSGKRVPWTAMLPFAIVTAFGLSLFAATTDLWLPRLFNTYTGRYGVIGATFALLSWLFSFMMVVVACSALGREVHEELEAINAGSRVDEKTVGEEWTRFRADVATRRAEVEAQVQQVRARRHERRRRRRERRRGDDGPPPSA